MRKPLKPHYEPYTIYECLQALNNNDLTLTYTDKENQQQTFATHAVVENVLKRFDERLIFLDTEEELSKSERRAAFLSLYNNWWTRRGPQFGKLMYALTVDYDPISNYDRHEEGSIITTHDIGERSGTDNLTDTFDDTLRTITETPRVEDTVTETPAVEETVTETPAVEETVTETPAVEETVTETPAVEETVTETPDTTRTNTRTPELSETTTETPRVATQTTVTPGVTMTTAKTYFGDNSSTAVPAETTTVSPDGTNSDITVVEPTSGTNETVKETEGTDEVVETMTGTNTTVTSREGSNTVVTSREGSNTVVTSREGSNTTVTSREGSNTTVTSHDGINTTTIGDNTREDTHNRSTSSEAAQDVDTQTFDEYRVYGNIGVTTSAQMITGEIELRGKFDLITHAIVEFVDLVSVYL